MCALGKCQAANKVSRGWGSFDVKMGSYLAARAAAETILHDGLAKLCVHVF